MERLTIEERRTIRETIIFIVLFGVGAACLSGCIPAVLGVKSYESTEQGTRIDFITGLDLGAQVNGIDRVDDNRGIAPRGEQSKKY